MNIFLIYSYTKIKGYNKEPQNLEFTIEKKKSL